MTARYSPAELAEALGIFLPTEEQAAVICAPPGPLVVIAGAGAGKTETMAARVVWLVANGYATPGEVLGLTFTRKAAGQLLRRVRTRLARLAGAGLVPATRTAGTDDLPTVSTYHAFAGTLLREHGLLLGVEPQTRLVGATELWQLAHRVVCTHPGPLPIDKTPAAVTAMVLALAGQLAEHLVGTDQLRDTHVELERLVHTLPAGPYQRDRGPSQWLLRMLATQAERTELVPLVDALHQRMRADNVMDFGLQMAAAARLASAFPDVGAQLRSRYRVVLLDEYQDTGHSQRVALSALFGGGVDDELALTAVGDPIQSIYGWRGASATNLPRFTTDFPLSDGSPAPTLELRTSWRNPPSTLHLANAVSTEARRRSVAVRALLPRPDAEPGTIRLALLNDVAAERDWVADQVAQRYHAMQAATGAPPTAAVLLRRNADAAPMAEALTARGVPVEVVGLSGLLGVAEVADVVAMLRLVADPTAGSAAMRTLTGPRWRLGGRDIAALWRRAVELDDSGGLAQTATAEQIVSRVAPDADAACLADAVCDPGPAERYSAEGFRRITALGDELTGLRAHLSFPVADLVTEIRRVLGVDAEARAAQPASAGWTGTEHLDAFTDVVADYASRPGASVAGLLAYLDAAMDVENGLPPAELAVSQDRVQILTVHAAKGLEWQLVAVPHLSGRVFPSTGKARTWLTDPADLPPLLRGDRATTTDHGVPVLDTSDVNDRKTLSDRINDHKSRLEQRRIDEERRLLYVALTRAEDTLLLSGHHWGGTEAKPRGPSEFLCELKDIIDRADEEGRPCGVVDQWTPEPAAGEVNPLRDNLTEVMWPADPTGEHRPDIEVGALHVTRAMTDGPAEGDDVEGWAADVDALLAERDRVARRDPLTLPVQVSVSTLVRLRAEPDEVLHRLQRRLPAPPAPHASLGTAFHEWVQRFYGAERLFDLDDLPGAADGAQRRGEEEQLAELQAAFMVSPWAARTPLDVEVPFDMVIGDTMVRGRIDAVFADPDGGATVVDWKTGAPPTTQEAREQAAIQLAVYRLAWAALRGVPVERVRAAFHYVRSGQTVNPSALPEASELAALLEGVATEVA